MIPLVRGGVDGVINGEYMAHIHTHTNTYLHTETVNLKLKRDYTFQTDKNLACI